MKEKNVILYILHSEAQTSKSVEGWLGHTVHTPCSYSNTIYRRENEHQGMVTIWPLPKGFRRWNEFTITARQLFRFLRLPLKVKWFYSISFERLDKTGRYNWALFTRPKLQRKEVYTLRYCISLTEVSSGSPAVNISAKSVMKRFPCRRKIRYASSQHWRNLQLIQANHRNIISERKQDIS